MAYFVNPNTLQVVNDNNLLTDPVASSIFYTPNNPYVPVTIDPEPSYDPILQLIAMGTPVQVNGSWTIPWTITDNNALQQASMLGAIQIQQTNVITQAYNQAITEDVTFTTSGGITANFQADPDSQNTLLLCATGYTFAGSTPDGFYWKASDNSEPLFNLADLHGLYLAMLTRGQIAFQKKQTLKAAINAVTVNTPTPTAAITAIVW